MPKFAIAIAILTLFAFCFLPQSIRLSVGRCYRNGRGDVFSIVDMIVQNNNEIFIAHNGMRFYSEGLMVGNAFKDSPYHIVANMRIVSATSTTLREDLVEAFHITRGFAIYAIAYIKNKTRSTNKKNWIPTCRFFPLS